MKRSLLKISVLLAVVFVVALPLTAQETSSTEEAEIIALIMENTQPITYQSFISPDGKWQTDIRIYDCTAINETDNMSYEVLEITQVDTGETQVLDSQLLYCGGLGAFGLSVLFWSENNQYLYYTDAREGQPDGIVTAWLRPVNRVDMTDLSITELGGALYNLDATLLAAWQGKELVILDTSGGELARFPAYKADGVLMEIFWLPDNTGLVYLQADSFPPPTTHSYLVYVDTVNLEQRLLLETDSNQ
jgi:hypothetical protein